MLAQHILTVLEDWRSEFESDRIIAVRDRFPKGHDKDHVRKIFFEIAAQLRLPAVSFGSCRMVFALDAARVLKVGFSRFGMRANRLEAGAARDLPRSLHAEVYEASPDGLWLVQERVTLDRSIDMRRHEARHLRRDLEMAVGRFIHDFYSGNVGRKGDGSLVILDLEFLNRLTWPGSDPAARRYLNV